MTKQPRSPTAAEDIAAQQSKIIQSLRTKVQTLEEANSQLTDTNNEQEQKIEYLKEVQQELNNLKAAFGNNGNVTYNEAMSTMQSQKNAMIQAECNRINYERQSQREAEEAARHDEEVKQVLAETNFEGYYNGEKNKVEQRKKTVLDAATRFYDMTDSEANLYFSDKHKPENSAIMDLINEYLDDQGKFTIYQCRYCEKEVYSLGELERHCWDNGHDHRDVNLNRIESNAAAAIAKLNNERLKDIEDAIKAKKQAAYKAQLAKQRAAETKAKQGLSLLR